jgi:hypothetical protein
MLRKIVQGLALTGVVLGAGALGAGCLDRPITNQAPDIKTNFTSAVNQSGIDKVDILFDIDNSASMGDKQSYLVAAIPQMIARLVTPRCLTSAGVATGVNADPTMGNCPAMSFPEFAAVHDMHIGVVTSSLGSRLGVQSGSGSSVTYVCDPNAAQVKSAGGTMVSPDNDDQGHLINRTAPFGSGPALAGAALPEGGGFLYWFPKLGNGSTPAVSPPSTPYTAIGTITTFGSTSLVGDFTELVGGAGESGCGIESQLESWYRFLIQPDPYLTLVNSGGATWSGVDTTIIQQRHDFLRPDSLVAIIVLSDENDSEIDVRSYAGSGYNFMSDLYPPPRGTTMCLTNPADPACVSCGSTPASNTDANCMINGGVYPPTPGNDWGSNLNLRHVHMGQKYGLTQVQFPLTRYYNGLTSTSGVPNRQGEYPSAGSAYTGTNNCSNPLFAGVLPTASDVPDSTAVTPTEVNTTLCHLTGTAARTPGDVFYAHIGGVPHELLQAKPGDKDAMGNTVCASSTAAADCPQKDTLTLADWTSILGNSAANYLPGPMGFPAIAYDYTGIDPHMIESQTPRNAVPALPGTPNSTPPVSSLFGPSFTTTVNPDPINGREWITTGEGQANSATFNATHSLPDDREYACIFPLPTATATQPSQQRDCALLNPATIEGNSCDCTANWSGGTAAAPANPSEQVPPLCAKTSTDGKITSSVGDYTVQVAAKAYPTIRELTLANMMGGQGIVSSLCPIHTNDNTTGDDPLYGYRPAVNAIVNRLKGALGAQCVPKLTPTPVDGGGSTIPCLVLVSFPKNIGPTSSTDCASVMGYSNVSPPSVLTNFNMQQAAAAGDSGSSVNLANEVTCQLNQVSGGSTLGASCVGGLANGWCYITGSAITGGSTCTQEIAYSASGLVPPGATINLQCISENNTNSGDGGTSQ